MIEEARNDGSLENQTYSRILVTLLAPIGDTLFATPALHALRERFPGAYIAVVAYPTNKGILEDNPDIDELFIHPILTPVENWVRIPGFFWTLNRRKFELAVDMNTFSIFLSRVVARVPRRLKLQLPPFWWIKSHLNHPWAYTHTIQHYLDIIKPLGIENADHSIRFTVRDEDRVFAEAFLTKYGIDQGDRVVVIHPGGEGFNGRKRWNAEGFAKVADALSRRHNVKILIIGGKDEVGLGAQVASLTEEGSLNIAGQTTLKQTAALIERSQLFIGNDSSPLHIAAALGTPAVGIFGPSNRNSFGPFGDSPIVVQKQLPCVPCFHFIGTSPFWVRAYCKECRALAETTPEEVLVAAERQLDRSLKDRG
jgi:ADP-heptose:LPS heptosyltransferase